VLAGSAAAMLVVVSGFTTRVIQKGREASEALQSLRETAPTFAVRAQDALREGQFEEALKAATFAVKLEPSNGEYHALRGNALQVLVRWPEALAAYKRSLELGEIEEAKVNLKLTEELMGLASKEGEAKAKAALFEALNAQGRQYEAMALSRTLGDFWKDRKKDLSVIPELVRRLEAKMLPVPGTKILLSKTEFTVGEWKLYLKAEGLPDWKQPSTEFEQNDEHPVLMVSWNDAKQFCEWLSKVTGKEWRLPTNAEWEAAVGTTKYPWGDYYPPSWDDGNYAVERMARMIRRKLGWMGSKEQLRWEVLI
jgi:tetratricopeptide (TPR) repeat protein